MEILFGVRSSRYIMNHSLLLGGGDGPPRGQTTVCTKVTRTVPPGRDACPDPLHWGPPADSQHISPVS